jgi:hypothetical protein
MVAYKSPFFHINLPSNVVNWVNKWFYVYDCNALAFSHQFPLPLPVRLKEDLSKLEHHEAD